MIVLSASACALVAANEPAFASQPSGSLSTAPAGPATPMLTPTNPGPNGYFEYTLMPNESADGSVLVRNPGAVTATFDLYPTDAMTSSATGVIYGGLNDPLRATGEWIRFATNHVVLGPRQSQAALFHLSVPAGTPPGDYIGGFSAENPLIFKQQENSNGAAVSLNVNTRVIISMVIHVPGTAAVAINLGKPALFAQNGNQQVIALPMNNTGGLLAKPTLAAAVARCGTESTLASLRRRLDTFVPRTAIVYDWPLGNQILAAGCYRITVTLTNLGSILSTTTADIAVTAAEASVIPPSKSHSSRNLDSGPNTPADIAPVVLLAAALVLLAVTLALGRRSRRRRHQLEQELATLKESTQNKEL